MQWFTKKNSGYWESICPLKIVHYCSSPKPWEDATLRRGGFLEEMWWKYYNEMQRVINTTSPMFSISPRALASVVLPVLQNSLLDVKNHTNLLSHSMECSDAHWCQVQAHAVECQSCMYTHIYLYILPSALCFRSVSEAIPRSFVGERHIRFGCWSE